MPPLDPRERERERFFFLPDHVLHRELGRYVVVWVEERRDGTVTCRPREWEGIIGIYIYVCVRDECVGEKGGGESERGRRSEVKVR